MSDKFGIDSHKIVYHPEELSKLLGAGSDPAELAKIYPIYVEVSPIGACNHRCTICAVDYIGYQSHNKLDFKVISSALDEMGENGVKSIMYAGEGEPLLHNKINEIVNKTKQVGIDVSFTTNAVALNDKFIEQSLDKTSWLKVSLNAGSAETYEKVHQTKNSDFYRVIDNLKRAVNYKKNNNIDCAIGIQSLLLPENANEMVDLAEIARDEIVVDYFVVKPYSKEPSSLTVLYDEIDYMSDLINLDEDRIRSLETEEFVVSYRSETMGLYHESAEQRYTKCYSTPLFMAYIMADGSLYGCKDQLLNPKFNYGNINTNSFGEIWMGDNRIEGIRYVLSDLSVSECRVNCRMDKINRFLFDLIEGKIDHVNFI